MKKSSALWVVLIGLSGAAHDALALQWGDEAKLKEFVSRQKEGVQVNAQTIDAMGLSASTLPVAPWSSTFWADYKGSIANPYNEGFKWPLGWAPNRSSIVLRADLQKNAKHIPASDLANLSPAEKYDLLVGDENFSLTRKVVAMLDARSHVDLLSAWSGVCHGWAPASLTVPRPERKFELMAPNGRMIPFYPDDVKALASYLWAKSNAQGATQVEGWQCQSGARSNREGRLVDPRCFDVNPAFMHLVMVNQVGLNRRGFIMDRAYRAEVQNQPVYAYTYKYYNPSKRNARTGVTLDQAKSYYASSFYDPYLPYRAPGTVAIVGVEATLWYGMETDPTHRATDSHEHDKSRKFTIRYDLELDAKNNIIGGEWREYDDDDAHTVFEQLTYKHPDLIWLVPPGLKAYSIADTDEIRALIQESKKDGGIVALDAEQRKKIVDASVKAAHNTEQVKIHERLVTLPAPQPLSSVVDYLIELSTKK